MSKDAKTMNCHAFQAQLADLIGSGEDAAAHAHLQTCTLCSQLLADLQTIAAKSFGSISNRRSRKKRVPHKSLLTLWARF